MAQDTPLYFNDRETKDPKDVRNADGSVEAISEITSTSAGESGPDGLDFGQNIDRHETARPGSLGTTAAEDVAAEVDPRPKNFGAFDEIADQTEQA